MSRLTTYMHCMDKEVHVEAYKCHLSTIKHLGITARLRDIGCHFSSCLRCAYFKHIPFEVEESLNHKETSNV